MPLGPPASDFFSNTKARQYLPKLGSILDSVFHSHLISKRKRVSTAHQELQFLTIKQGAEKSKNLTGPAKEAFFPYPIKLKL